MMQPHKAPSCISFFLLICLHCLVFQVSSLDTLKQGDELNSSSQLVSANGIFTLGFYTPRENYSYLAVWFTDFTDYSPYKPVWIGNREKPIPNNTSSVLTIGTKGELIITHDEGEAISLYAGGGSGQNVTATLLDTGNFVVKEMNSNGGEFLWQSFDDPTDTLLPGMKIGVNQRTRKNRTLTSWFGENNPAPGPFTLEWDPGAGKLLVRRRGVVYWTSGELKEYYDKDLGRVKEFENFLSRPDAFNFNYNLTNITSDEGEYFMYSLIQVPNLTPDQRKVISGWRMEYLGDIYDTDRGTVVRPSLCYGYKTTPRPNTPAGCEPWPQQHKCSDHRQMFEERSGNFKTGDNGPLLSSGTTYDGSSSLSESDCRDFCWKNCSCVGYRSAIGRPGCEYWIGKDFVFVQSVDGSALKQYVLVAASPGEGNKKLILIILTVASSIILLSLGITLLVLRKIKQRRREEELHELLRLDGQTDNCELENGGANSHDLKLFTYASIQSATNNFSSDKKLGQGGFGPVYKGRTQEGQDIAVKLLSRQSGQGLLEFKTELILISKLQHVNLVKLLGFCIHGDDKMIIYDYVPNKSLDFFLFSPSEKKQLNWQKRFNIIEGTAQGLLYLHKHSRLRIIHRDLKPSNILLDKNMDPKISDFGLARIFKQNANEANTNRPVGTYGYLAPEYAMEGIFSVKSDVYSFGVLVLEIVSGRKNNSFHQIEGPLSLVEYAWELWRKDCASELMDPTLRDSCIIDQLQRCIHIGLLCVENQAVDRPTIEDVISMLKNEMITLPMPKNPAFITRSSVLEEVEKSTTPEKLSANEVTLSEMGGR